MADINTRSAGSQKYIFDYALILSVKNKDKILLFGTSFSHNHATREHDKTVE